MRQAMNALEDEAEDVLATLKTPQALIAYAEMLRAYGVETMAALEDAIAAGADPESLRAFVFEHRLDWDLQWTRSRHEIIADDIARALGYAVRARQLEGIAEESRRASLFERAKRCERQQGVALLQGRQALWRALVSLHGQDAAALRLIGEATSAADIARISERASVALDRIEAEEAAA